MDPTYKDETPDDDAASKLKLSVFSKYAYKTSFFSLLCIPFMIMMYYIGNNYQMRNTDINAIFLAPLIVCAPIVLFCIVAGFIQITYQCRYGLNEIFRSLVILMSSVILMLALYLAGFCPRIDYSVPLHGKYVFAFHPNGQKQIEAYFWFGKNCRTIEWHDNQRKRSECYVEENNGYAIISNETEWHRNGQIKIKGEKSVAYYSGSRRKPIKIGVWQYFGETGKLTKEELYNDNGKLIKSQDYTNNTPSPQSTK